MKGKKDSAGPPFIDEKAWESLLGKSPGLLDCVNVCQKETGTQEIGTYV